MSRSLRPFPWPPVPGGVGLGFCLGPYMLKGAGRLVMATGTVKFVKGFANPHDLAYEKIKLLPAGKYTGTVMAVLLT